MAPANTDAIEISRRRRDMAERAYPNRLPRLGRQHDQRLAFARIAPAMAPTTAESPAPYPMMNGVRAPPSQAVLHSTPPHTAPAPAPTSAPNKTGCSPGQL